jgi:hypothetical protein
MIMIMIKGSDEGVSQAKIGQRLGFPLTTHTHTLTVIKHKEKVRGKAESATQMNSTINRKTDIIVADMETLNCLD